MSNKETISIYTFGEVVTDRTDTETFEAMPSEFLRKRSDQNDNTGVSQTVDVPIEVLQNNLSALMDKIGRIIPCLSANCDQYKTKEIGVNIVIDRNGSVSLMGGINNKEYAVGIHVRFSKDT